MSEKMPELLPCPFCAEPAKLSESRDGHVVICISGYCSTNGPMSRTSEIAAKRWNTRADLAQPAHDPDAPKRYWLIEQPELDDDDDYKTVHTTDLDVYPGCKILGEYVLKAQPAPQTIVGGGFCGGCQCDKRDCRCPNNARVGTVIMPPGSYSPGELMGRDQPAPHPDDIAVDKFAAAMKEKMAKKRTHGEGGWNNKEDCGADHLRERMMRHIEKGDPVDVGNFCMMLFNRDESTAPTQPAPASDNQPTQQDLENLWQMVVVQNTGEDEAAFMVNWLRGSIKIPREVKLRLAAQDAPASDAVKGALDDLEKLSKIPSVIFDPKDAMTFMNRHFETILAALRGRL